MEKDTSVEKVVFDIALFANVGLVFASFMLAISYLFTNRDISNLSIIHPAIGYTFSALMILICIKKSSNNNIILDATRDSTPPLIFALAAYQSGVRENWLVIFLCISIIYSFISMYYGKKF